MTEHDKLLKLVRSRKRASVPFLYGLSTADRYVLNLRREIGEKACHRHLCTDGSGWTNFDDILRKAAGTLVYSSPEMEVKARQRVSDLPSEVVKPKNALMIFRHVLTTSTKDRDGDIMRTSGAELDPKMLLLWQHVHTLPIGKMLGVAKHTKDELQLFSCVVDMNELCHDAAVMIDNDMGRFSHGFRALDFLEIKAEEDGKARDDREGPGGFDVKRFEILEESLVSVPANPDTEVEEVVLSLVEGGKLTSGLMKDYGATIRERRPLTLPVSLDLKITVNDRELRDANERGDEQGEGRGGGREEKAAGEPEEAAAVSGEGEKGQESEDEEVREKHGDHDQSTHGRGGGGGDGDKLGLAESDAMAREIGLRDFGSDGTVSSDYFETGKKFRKAGWKEKGKTEWLQNSVGQDMRTDRYAKGDYTAKVTASALPGFQRTKVEFYKGGGKSFDPEGQKPYPNEHAMRLNDPGKYAKIRRQNDKFGRGVHAIFGVTEDGKTELQAIRFSADQFTAEEAKKWLEDNDYDTDGFEPAKKPEKQLIDDSVSGGTEAVPPSTELEREGKQMVCTECEYVGPAKAGKCPECGAKMTPRKDFVFEKLGRVLNKANEGKIREAIDDLDEAGKMDNVPRGCKALIASARRGLNEVISSLGSEQGVEKRYDVEEAMTVLLALGDEKSRIVLKSLLEVFERNRESDELVERFEELLA